MAVQAGLWNFDGEPPDRGFIARMSRATEKFGPDGEQEYFDHEARILYRPFYTTLESSSERQPYACSNHTILTWDGRLDNRDELLSRLPGHMSSNSTDVALVAAALDSWGFSCFEKLLGDWALVLWNSSRKELVLARDYIGVKQLFYYPRRNGVAWSSHLAALVLCGDQFSICDEYVAGYLAFHPDVHLTPYREIHSVSPGNYICITPSGIQNHEFWALKYRAKPRYKKDSEYEEEYRYLFRQAVRRRLRTNSPVIAELSGGLDSSSMVCMADNIAAKEAGISKVDTFSYYDSLEPGEDDLPHLTSVEKWREQKGLHVDLKGSGDSLEFCYPAFVATPGFGSRAEIKIALSKAIQQSRYRVMLCGVGGDELNGQPLDPCLLMAELLARLELGQLTKSLMGWSLRMRRPMLHLLAQTISQFFPAVFRAPWADVAKVEPWVDLSFARKYQIPFRQMEVLNGIWFFRPTQRDAMQTIETLRRQLSNRLPSLVDRRFPYLDQQLVEYLTAVPLDQLLRPGERRSLMRRALHPILPPAIQTRKTKTGAGRCYAITLDKHWPQMQRLLRSPLISTLGYVNSEQYYPALLAMRNGKVPTYFLRLLKALSLELWLRDANARGVLCIPAPNACADEGGLTHRRAVPVDEARVF